MRSALAFLVLLTTEVAAVATTIAFPRLPVPQPLPPPCLLDLGERDCLPFGRPLTGPR